MEQENEMNGTITSLADEFNLNRFDKNKEAEKDWEF